MDQKVERIITALPNLRKRDLEMIAAATSHLLKKTGSHDPNEDYIFEALKKVLGLSMSLKRLKASDAGKHWASNWPIFHEFMAKTFPQVMDNLRKRLALSCYILDTIKRDISYRGMTPTPGLMITHLIRVAEVFDRAFPGYRGDKNMMILIGNLILSGKRHIWGSDE